MNKQLVNHSKLPSTARPHQPLGYQTQNKTTRDSNFKIQNKYICQNSSLNSPRKIS